jgi:hypothetical protein
MRAAYAAQASASVCQGITNHSTISCGVASGLVLTNACGSNLPWILTGGKPLW